MINKAEILQKYIVTDEGHVISRKTGKRLLGKVDKYGYRHLAICLESGIKHTTEHRIVALCNIENQVCGNQINHKDGNKLNNHVSNLEWCDARHNTQHAYDNGLAVAWNKGKTGIYSKENIEAIIRNQPNRKPVMAVCGEVSYKYDSLRTLCREMGFDRRTAMRVLKGEQNYNSIKGFKICYQ